jgi:hypothetical protein
MWTIMAEMPLNLVDLLAVITYRLLCVAAVLVFALVPEHHTCVGAFNLKALR